MNYRFVGNIAGTENATVKATLSYLTDYRDPEGRVPPPVLLFERRPGQEWTGQPGGGPAWVWGPSASTDPTPRVLVTYTVLQSGLPPFARVLERRIMPNTDTPGYWDFTRGDEAQPPFVGGSGTPTPIEVLPGQGPAGERGPGWLFGQGVPSPASGRNGDLYLDLSGWDVYTRSGGGWTLGGNLKGATGGVGAQGPKGTDGKGFPLPSEAQLGFIPVADGSQPAGFGWHALAELGMRLRDLMDVDLLGLTDGQTLVWNGTEKRWKPGVTGSSTSTLDKEGVAAMFVEGPGVTLAYDPAAGTVTVSVTNTGGTVGAFTYRGQLATVADLPVSAATGDTYSTADTNHLHAWNGATWVDNGPIGVPGVRGPAGDQGPAGAKGDPGATGRGIATVAVSSGHLAGTYTDGTAWDAGMLPAGTGTGGGLSSVAHDTTLTGDGTPATPLGVNATIGSLPGRVAALELEGNTGTRFVGVRAINTVSQDIPNGQYWQMRLNSPVYDTDGFLDAGQNRIIIPPGLSGIYEIGAWIAWESNSAGRRFAAIRLDSNVLIANGQPAMSTGSSYGIVHIHHPLHAGSTIDLSGFQDSGSTLNTRADVTLPGMSCTLYLHRLGPLPS